ncbi:MAG: adenylosuccinate synthase [Puniceicoccaceae bacterium 5H]|nr:MAG: adenylosuccinate synthase [Puniceicoccaceae bacterium 5H]
MARPPFHHQIILDTGISFGDEGKGRLIPEVITELREQSGRDDIVGAVVKVNGGANSGHTCGGLKLNLFPAGVVNPEAGCLAIGSGVVADPRKFIWEAAYIEHNGYRVHDRLLIDERAMVSDVCHRLLDLAWEFYRVHGLGEEARGSTGRGISPAYTDETGCFPIYYSDFRSRERFRRLLRGRVERAMRTIQYVCNVTPEAWEGFFDTLTQAEQRANQVTIDAGLLTQDAFDFHAFKGKEPFTLDFERLEQAYWEAGQQLIHNIGNVRERLLEVIHRGQYILAEFGQAFWLDKRFGFTPNVTASHPLPPEFFLSCGLPLQGAHTFGVCKAYDTKVGTHTFLCRIGGEHPLGQKLSHIEFGTSTGRQRMVGWFDAVEKGDAIRYAGCTDLAINKLDALSYDAGGAWNGGELLICTGYKAPDGTRLKHVPRDFELHKQLQPIYRQYPGWSEDISGVRTFDNLPLNAKRYVAGMVKHTLEVAYGEHESQWPEVLPNVRYLGVGPNPSQIIKDVPATRELIKLAQG